MSKLTPKQEKFCQKYIELGNASEAYRQSYDAEGMKPETINRNAHAQLANSKIAARIAELKEKLEKRHENVVDRAIRELHRLSFMDIRKAFDADGNLKPIHELDDDTAAAIAGIEVEVRRVAGSSEEELEGQPNGGALKRNRGGSVSRIHKLKLSDKRASLELLFRHLGLLKDRLEMTGKDGQPLIPQRIEIEFVDSPASGSDENTAPK